MTPKRHFALPKCTKFTPRGTGGYNTMRLCCCPRCLWIRHSAVQRVPDSKMLGAVVTRAVAENA